MAQEQITIAIFISGRGSHMKTLVQALKKHRKANFCCVISDNAQAQGITKAKELGLAVHIIKRTDYIDKTHFEKQIINTLAPYRPRLIVLAGFMQLLSAEFIRQYPHILNIHPSLLPKYPGLNTHQRALDNNDKYVGATVHWVNEVMDGGKIIQQCRILVERNDTKETLSTRLLPLEHQLYQQVIRHLLDYNLLDSH